MSGILERSATDTVLPRREKAAAEAAEEAFPAAPIRGAVSPAAEAASLGEAESSEYITAVHGIRREGLCA